MGCHGDCNKGGRMGIGPGGYGDILLGDSKAKHPEAARLT